MLRVLVNGAKGRMGRETVAAVRAEPDLELVGETDLGDDLGRAIRESGAQVVVDFTVPAAVVQNVRTILEAGACPVVGTTGFREEDIRSLQARAAELKRGGVIAPNFAIGAVLLMKFAAQAARYFPSVEIVEIHHDQKLDAPSGTAIKTAECIAEARGGPAAPGEAARRDEEPGTAGPAPPGDSPGEPPRGAEVESIAGVRGGLHRGVRIHSVRLPGCVAHQEVLFGGPGQVLTLRHDALSRAAFMPGVILAVRKAPGLDRLYYGLEHILDL